MKKKKVYSPLTDHPYGFRSMTTKFKRTKGGEYGNRMNFHVRAGDGWERQTYCDGGGYDMQGTAFADWMMRAFPKDYIIDRIGPLVGRLYLETEDNDSYPHRKGLNFHRIDDQLVYISKEARLYGSSGRFDEESLMTTTSYLHFDGACGYQEMEKILYFLGYTMSWLLDDKGGSYYNLLKVDDETYVRKDHYNIDVLPESDTNGNFVLQIEDDPGKPEGWRDWGGERLSEFILNGEGEPIITKRTIGYDRVMDLDNFVRKIIQSEYEEVYVKDYPREGGVISWTSEAHHHFYAVSVPPKRTVTLLRKESNIECVDYVNLWKEKFLNAEVKEL